MAERKVKIRAATNADAETIAVLSRDTFYETFAPYNSSQDMEIFLRQQFTHHALVEEVRFPSNYFFLAYLGNDLAGYVKLRDAGRPMEISHLQVLEIARIYVKKKMLGQGVGKELMQLSHDVARQKNKQGIWLAVWENNKRALDFYTDWGFQIFGSQVFVLGNDVQNDWLMIKRLT